MSIFHYALRLYKFLARSQLRSFLEKEVAALPVSGRVLIVGAGGDCEFVIRKAGERKLLQFESIDIDPSRAPTIIGDVQTYSFPGGFFDAIIVPEVLEHLSDPRLALGNLYRSLKTAGRIIITVPFIFPIHDLPRDYFRFTSFGLKELFRDFNDFKIVKKNNWPEAMFILPARLLFSDRKRNAYLGFLFLLSYLLLWPILKMMGLLFPDDNITTGYMVSAVK